MNLAIIGDSFSSNASVGSWVEILSRSHEVNNYSLRSISQYRILDILTKNLPEILKADTIIIWHTNPDRVYVNNEVQFPTRSIASHCHADLVAADSLGSPDKDWQTIVKTYYKIFYNQEQQLVYYRLMFEKIKTMLTKRKVIHFSGFNLTDLPDIKSFAYLLETNPGTVNHYDLVGNQKVANYINSML